MLIGGGLVWAVLLGVSGWLAVGVVGLVVGDVREWRQGRREVTTMGEREYATGWVCTDCVHLEANGEMPPEWDRAEAEAWLERVEASGDWSLGMMLGEDGCEHSEDEYAEHAEQCERVEFSWSACDSCGSRLGGAREAATFWL